METTHLEIKGQVQHPQEFTFTDLLALPGQVPDVSTLIAGRQGGGVWLRALLDAAGRQPDATHLTLQSADGAFSASVPLDAVLDRAVVVYRDGDEPLPARQGGPMRFFITDVEACALGEVDACANVKYLGVIELTRGPGADTRPTTAREHEALHEHGEHQG